MSRKVSYVRFQTNMWVPGAADIGITLPPMGKSFEKLEMTLVENGLFVSFQYRGIKKELLFPFGNIVGMELVPESKAE